MKFKNDFEKRCFNIAQSAFGDAVAVEHNKTIQIESALFPEIASFKGPPTKEVDVLVAEILSEPKIKLLISCKFLTRKAEPAHVQEWCSVVQTMNRYADGTIYFGIVLSRSGFTAGCESWATSHNLGLIPPLKGRRLDFNADTVLRMFNRFIKAMHRRVKLQYEDLVTPPAFSDFVYGLVADFEGHQEAATDGRYYILPQGWVSSFAEMYSSINECVVEDLVATENGAVIKFTNGLNLRFTGERVEVGSGECVMGTDLKNPQCWKNFERDPCELDFIKSLVMNKTISSAGDFGNYIELGVDGRFNLGLHPKGFHLFSTENLPSAHKL